MMIQEFTSPEDPHDDYIIGQTAARRLSVGVVVGGGEGVSPMILAHVFQAKRCHTTWPL